MALRTEIPGPKELDLANCGQHPPGSYLAVTHSLAAGAEDFPLVGAGRFASK
jgi:hypothetical protein